MFSRIGRGGVSMSGKGGPQGEPSVTREDSRGGRRIGVLEPLEGKSLSERVWSFVKSPTGVVSVGGFALFIVARIYLSNPLTLVIGVIAMAAVAVLVSAMVSLGEKKPEVFTEIGNQSTEADLRKLFSEINDGKDLPATIGNESLKTLSKILETYDVPLIKQLLSLKDADEILVVLSKTPKLWEGADKLGGEAFREILALKYENPGYNSQKMFAFLSGNPNLWQGEDKMSLKILIAILKLAGGRFGWKKTVEALNEYPNLWQGKAKLPSTVLEKILIVKFPEDKLLFLGKNSNLWQGEERLSFEALLDMEQWTADALNKYPNLWQGKEKLPFKTLEKILSSRDPSNILNALGANPNLWQGEGDKVSVEALLKLLTKLWGWAYVNGQQWTLDALNQFSDLWKGIDKLSPEYLEEILSSQIPYGTIGFLGKNPGLWKGKDKDKLPPPAALGKMLLSSSSDEGVLSFLNSNTNLWQGTDKLSIGALLKVFALYNGLSSSYVVQQLTIKALNTYPNLWQGEGKLPSETLEKTLSSANPSTELERLGKSKQMDQK